MNYNKENKLTPVAGLFKRRLGGHLFAPPRSTNGTFTGVDGRKISSSFGRRRYTRVWKLLDTADSLFQQSFCRPQSWHVSSRVSLNCVFLVNVFSRTLLLQRWLSLLWGQIFLSLWYLREIGTFVYRENVLDAWVQFVKNGSKNKSIAFIFLFIRIWSFELH